MSTTSSSNWTTYDGYIPKVAARDRANGLQPYKAPRSFAREALPPREPYKVPRMPPPASTSTYNAPKTKETRESAGSRNHVAETGYW
ncbi:uncharacterized protein PAC_08315 [Phialocephala subalpina]|uniref:Uncharacterized protein n=1 Tax=Phialocephala subalpina TaxID=576137 RepID=A0A1L7X081_9HELO|nr:uncharacterized protein PAC_08315 [Phialocephala subalpina]